MKNKETKQERLTSGDIANHFSVSKSTVLMWVKEDKLIAYTLPSKHLRFEKEEINKFANKYGMPEIK